MLASVARRRLAGLIRSGRLPAAIMTPARDYQPQPITPAEITRIRDARAAGPVLVPAAEPIRVQRRVSSAVPSWWPGNASTSVSATP
jgi:hypothetical protein